MEKFQRSWSSIYLNFTTTFTNRDNEIWGFFVFQIRKISSLLRTGRNISSISGKEVATLTSMTGIQLKQNVNVSRLKPFIRPTFRGITINIGSQYTWIVYVVVANEQSLSSECKDDLSKLEALIPLEDIFQGAFLHAAKINAVEVVSDAKVQLVLDKYFHLSSCYILIVKHFSEQQNMAPCPLPPLDDRDYYFGSCYSKRMNDI